ncbi:SET domain-containing protein [Phlegmacium glaucopus]|nr:SET domain-containing protein [Phlegmacium glaucopus]
MPETDRSRILLQWCASKPHPIWFDSRLLVEERDSAIGVYSVDSFIPPKITLVKIPKDLVLSVRSCSLSGLISVVPYGLDAQLSLSLALYIEILKGNQSKWHGYLQSLPTEIIDLPLFWDQSTNQDDAKDGLEALRWLRGTSVERILLAVPEDGSTLIDTICTYYHHVVVPLLLDHLDLWRGPTSDRTPSLYGYYRSFSLVSSRAFLVDAYHGLSMVPIADAFNHIQENHVHLESDYNVCPDCGSLDECQHDRDDNSNQGHQRLGSTNGDTQLGPKGNSHDIYYEMVSNACIPPLTEIFNTYGDDLTNAQLLTQYGFTLDINDNDRVSWTAAEALHILTPVLLTEGDLKEFLTHLRQALPLIPGDHPLFEHSQLVYFNPLTLDEFCINDEGKVSHYLWILLALLACRALGLCLSVDVGAILRRLLDLQLDLESLVEVDDEVEASPTTMPDEFDPELAGLLLEMSSSITTLCSDRRHANGKPGSSNLDLFGLLDALPEEHPRTRHALLILIGERSILDGCGAGWEEFKTTLVRVDKACKACIHNLPLSVHFRS